jgi:hypothetical protein
MSAVTVGTLLAGIAHSIGEGLRILSYADKRQWGPDEHEQMRLLEETLDDAKKDFQELSPLVNGQFYYENDRKSESWCFFMSAVRGQLVLDPANRSSRCFLGAGSRMGSG